MDTFGFLEDGFGLGLVVGGRDPVGIAGRFAGVSQNGLARVLAIVAAERKTADENQRFDS